MAFTLSRALTAAFALSTCIFAASQAQAETSFDIAQNECSGMILIKNQNIFSAKMTITESKAGVSNVVLAYNDGVEFTGTLKFLAGSKPEFRLQHTGESSGLDIKLNATLTGNTQLDNKFRMDGTLGQAAAFLGLFECTNQVFSRTTR